MKKLTLNNIKVLFKPREKSSHKGSHGHALLVAGHKGCMGAAVIAAQACLRSGVGLLTVNVPEKERLILQTAIPEAMLLMREDDIMDLSSFTAIGIGPGLGTGSDSKKLLTSLIKNAKQPLVLDADALNILSADKKLFDKIPSGSILTPHPKEFDRFFPPTGREDGKPQDDVERTLIALKKAKELNCIIVLKGHQTLIATPTQSFLNSTGNAGLAKGGSGDALTGMITSFLAQGYEPQQAAVLGVYLHGLAADLTLKNQSMESMLITDVISNLGLAFRELM